MNDLHHNPGSSDRTWGTGDGRIAALVRPRGARTRAVMGICGLLLAGGVAAGCGGSGAAAPGTTPTTNATANKASATAATVAPTTTTTTQPAQCGAPRDPLDPTNAPAPNPPTC